jgi:cytochrome c biogenesis protein CcdA
VSLIILAFAGGLLTAFSPCVLPIVPLVFSRAVRPSGERAFNAANRGAMFNRVLATIRAFLRDTVTMDHALPRCGERRRTARAHQAAEAPAKP